MKDAGISNRESGTEEARERDEHPPIDALIIGSIDEEAAPAGKAAARPQRSRRVTGA